MSGVNVVRYLLAANATLIASVPSTKIMAGVLPLNTAMPAIGITQISASSRNIVAMNSSTKMVTERVQVTVMAESYPSKKAILNLVRAALPKTRGTVDSINVDSVIDDTEGPDLDDPATGIYTQSQDFIVRFNR